MSKTANEPFYCPLAACDHNERGVCTTYGDCDYESQDEPEEEDDI